MKFFGSLSTALLMATASVILPSCQPQSTSSTSTEATAPADSEESYLKALVRVNSTFQTWNIAQPWDKNQPYQRSALGVVLNNHYIITTAEMAANATYIELEIPDSGETITAEVEAIDYEANLVLLKASDDEGKEVLSKIPTVDVAKPAAIKSEIEIVQLEENGNPLISKGNVQGTDMLSTFAPGSYFLAYKVKASLQSATSSFTLPSFANGKLLGLLTTYDSEDQVSNIISCEVIQKFLTDSEDGDYQGFPRIGLAAEWLEDPALREYLGLQENSKGLYVTSVKTGAAADSAGILEGDVLLKVAGEEIDKKGYYSDPVYGRTFWTHLVRGRGNVGEGIDFVLLRDGKELEVSVIPKSSQSDASLIPEYTYDAPPHFLVKGGLVFQELSRSFLEGFDNKNWRDKAPLNLMMVYENQNDLLEKGNNRVVILTGVIPTPATIGYESMRNAIVEQVNGQQVKDMDSLIAAFANGDGSIHSIDLDRKPSRIYLDELLSTEIDGQLLQRGLPYLSRTASDTDPQTIETSEEKVAEDIQQSNG